MSIYAYLSEATRDQIDALCDYHFMSIPELLTYLVTKEYQDVLNPYATNPEASLDLVPSTDSEQL